jgi:enamine deaminase RidA (YjgF/YER057c/UK114 family)
MDLKKQIDQAFSNIDLALKSAGGKGMSQVFRITSYHPNLTNDAMKAVKENLEKWFPHHRPIWTAVGVEKLAFPEMLVEIEAAAYDPPSA